MVRFILSLILRLIVTTQSLVNLGIAETAVYLRAVEVVTILGKDYTLHLIGVALIFEANINAFGFQPFQQCRPIRTSCNLPFESLIYLVTGFVRLFQSVCFYLFFTFCEVQPVFACQLLADAFTAITVIPVADGSAVIIHTIKGNMNVRMLLVIVSSYDVLRITNAHFLHIFPAYLNHKFIC